MTPRAKFTSAREGTVYDEHLRFLKGHNARVIVWFSKTDGRWYVSERKGKARTPWARIVSENEIGRPLTHDEHAHHVNGNKGDDRPENLQVLTVAEHTRLHAEERRSHLLS